MSSTQKTVLALLVLFVAYGVVGRIDYEEAVRAAQAHPERDVHLLCWPARSAPVYGEERGACGRIVRAAQVQQPEGTSPPVQTELRCLVLDN